MRFGEVTEADIVVHVEVDPDLGAVQLHRGHLADPETGHLDRGSGPQAAGLREVGRVVVGRECENGSLSYFSATTASPVVRAIPERPMRNGFRSAKGFISVHTVLWSARRV